MTRNGDYCPSPRVDQLEVRVRLANMNQAVPSTITMIGTRTAPDWYHNLFYSPDGYRLGIVPAKALQALRS